MVSKSVIIWPLLIPFFLVTLATGFVSFSIYYHFLCKIFTNFSPIRHANDVKGTYFVKKINIYLIRNSFLFTSRGPRIFGFISSAAHFSVAFVHGGARLHMWPAFKFHCAHGRGRRNRGWVEGYSPLPLSIRGRGGRLVRDDKIEWQ